MEAGKAVARWGALFASLAVLPLLVVSAPGAPSDPGPSILEAEAAIYDSNVAAKLEVGMGDAFGGAWFERETAQLRVGYVSASSRRAAEAVARAEGVAEFVTPAAVDSTWAELEAAQDRWDNRLIGLLTRGDASTWVSPDSNSVEVELASGVSRAQRDALESSAERAPVGVSIVATRSLDLGSEPLARCNPHEGAKAYCDPTLVSGVTVESPKGVGRQSCTAGPPVIDRVPTDTTKTYVLTAGHCIFRGGGVNKTWFAYNKKAEELEIGSSLALIYGPVDIGVIEITTKNWAEKGLTPLSPVIANWEKAELEPFPITGDRDPLKGTEACISGQFAEIECGTIVRTGRTGEFVEGKDTFIVKDLIEVNGPKAFFGDSGAPWFTKAGFKKTPPEGVILGTMVGESGKTALPEFQALGDSLATLKKEKGMDLRLLTDGRKVRAACPMPAMPCSTFHVGPSITYVTGEDEAAHSFSFGGVTVECATAQFVGALDSPGEDRLRLHPTFSGCTAGGEPATVTTTGCDLLLSSEIVGEYAPLTILCSETDRIELVTSACTFYLDAQRPSQGTAYSAVGSGSSQEITAAILATDVSVADSEGSCESLGESGSYTGTAKLEGFAESGHSTQVGIHVE